MHDPSSLKTHTRFCRAVWVTPELDVFVAARLHMSWSEIHREWVDTYPDRAAPANGENLRLHYRGRVPKKTANPIKQHYTRTLRECLSCRNPFQSEGIHNRMCSTCKNRGW